MFLSVKKNDGVQLCLGKNCFLKYNIGKRVDDVETERSKRKQVAEIILRVSGLPPRKLTDETVASILMQWRNNNLLKLSI